MRRKGVAITLALLLLFATGLYFLVLPPSPNLPPEYTFLYKHEPQVEHRLGRWVHNSGERSAQDWYEFHTKVSPQVMEEELKKNLAPNGYLRVRSGQWQGHTSWVAIVQPTSVGCCVLVKNVTRINPPRSWLLDMGTLFSR